MEKAIRRLGNNGIPAAEQVGYLRGIRVCGLDTAFLPVVLRSGSMLLLVTKPPYL